ncbi:Peroxisomal membrane protein 13 [Chlorella vulgaris]
MSGRAPLKPWEQRAGSQSSPSPAEGLPKPWERPAPGTQTVTPAAATSSALTALTSGGGGVVAPAPRPWDRSNAAGANYGGVGTSYNSTGYGAGAYGSSMYNRPYGALGGSSGMYGGGYGGGYGGNMGGYGGSMYGRPGMYGGGTYAGAGYGAGGGMYGGMYSGMLGQGPMGPYDPNDPMGPPQPPSAWQGMLQAISGVVHFFGRLSFLVDENAHAVHFFISALLQLLDRFGSLYGELARFVLRLLGFKARERKNGQDVPAQQHQQPAPTAAVLQGNGVPGVPVAISACTHRGPANPPGSTTTKGWEGLWSKD